MDREKWVLLAVGWAWAVGGWAQDATPDAQARAMGRDFTTRPSSPARVAHQSALTVQAFQLIDYCTNPAIGNDFVAARLEKFSKMSGRPEDCKTLHDYWPGAGGLGSGSGGPAVKK